MTAFLGVALLGVDAAFGQGTRADYERAAALAGRFRGKVTGMDLQSTWSADGAEIVFRRVVPGRGHRFLRLRLVDGDEAAAFDHDALAELLRAEEGGGGPDVDELPVLDVRFGDDEMLWLIAKAGDASRIVRVGGDGDVEAVDLDGAHPFRLSAAPPSAERRSRDRGGEVHILFANRTAAPVQLHWADRSGKRMRYGDVAPGQTRRQHTFSGHVWVVTDTEGEALAVFEGGPAMALALIDGPVPEPDDGDEPERPTPEPGVSPDGRWRAFIRNHNVVVRRLGSDEETDLSTDGVEEARYEGRIHWSPNSTHLAVTHRTLGEPHIVTMVGSSPSDQRQPKVHEHNYHKPGDRIDVRRPAVFDVINREAVELAADLFPTPWSVGHYHWSADGERFLFLHNQRGHHVLRLLACDVATGMLRTVVEETPETFVCYSSKSYLHYLDETDEAIWMSERSGWNHLYLVDTRVGGIKNAITTGNWVVRSVERVEAGNRRLLLKVMGVYPDQDPYHIHHAWVGFDGTGFQLLTTGDGTHSVAFSPGGEYYTDSYSRVDLPPVKELRRSADGTLVTELTRADATALKEEGWQAPEPFVAKGRDGETDIWGVIYRPTELDTHRKYPIIEAIYAGPHGHHVPKSFAAFRGPQALCELGFIVVQIDGMGTNWRSKAFHDVCWKNIGDAGFPDRVAWLKAAAERFPYMDLTRVGIYGGSAGGQNAMRALIAHHDVYKAAVADCGCHDNRMDKIWWNEQWMGWPIDEEAYDASSNVTQAHRMEGHLMLQVGELDRNVDPASTMQVVDALIKADKDFDLVVFPGKGHGAGGSPYGQRRMRDFFVRHLLGVEPRR